jgi:hypothetical protein
MAAAETKKARRVLRAFLREAETVVSGRREPVARVEWTAHAQRQRRHVKQFVGRHRLFAVCGYLLSLFRPIPLANVWGAGYRKE